MKEIWRSWQKMESFGSKKQLRCPKLLWRRCSYLHFRLENLKTGQILVLLTTNLVWMEDKPKVLTTNICSLPQAIWASQQTSCLHTKLHVWHLMFVVKRDKVWKCLRHQANVHSHIQKIWVWYNKLRTNQTKKGFICNYKKVYNDWQPLLEISFQVKLQ